MGSHHKITIADKLSPEVFDPPIFAAMYSPNLQVAAERIAIHKRLLGPMRLRVELDADGLDLELGWPAGDPSPQSFRSWRRHSGSPLPDSGPELR